MLNAFRASLPLCIASSLDAKPSRCLHVSNIESVNARGRALWKQIHRPLDTKLEHKLAQAHPDLPVFIVHNVYGGLFADPERVTGAMLGRIATSLCNRLPAGTAGRRAAAAGPCSWFEESVGGRVVEVRPSCW